MSLGAFKFPSDYSPSSAFLVGWRVVLALPRHLWNVYTECLWRYQPNTWVSRLASAFRILAVVLVFPVALLTLLDVTSYVIARTLGIVDDIKASTVDPDTDVPSITSVTSPLDGSQTQIHLAAQVPISATRAQKANRKTSSTNTSSSMSAKTNTSTSNHDVRAPVPTSERYDLHGSEELDKRQAEQGCASERAVGTSSFDTVSLPGIDYAQASGIQSGTQRNQVQVQKRQYHEKEGMMGLRSVDDDHSDWEATRSDAVLSSNRHHAYHFAGEDYLRLAGEGVFSPAASMPPSPLAPRAPLHAFVTAAEEYDGGREVLEQVGEGDIATLRRRAQGVWGDEPSHNA